ncbi:MAG: MoxR family ATPase [Chloroflexia bacterium]|jgi:MoxR-like ATPase|nr:MoxR family ATPase [Chloroflexia bacterium]
MPADQTQHLSGNAIDAIQETTSRIVDAIERVIIGKREVIELTLIGVLCEGHVLLEDVPGTGKTMLARSLASALGGSFNRIQFTPDLLPTDITGALVFSPRTSEFSYRPGPIISNVLLADEINRAGPRTQSALLEAMSERQVTVDLERVSLPRPFFVIATQNPVELEGTFPLPEAQLDRFLMRTTIGYPSADDERKMLRRFRNTVPLDDIQAVTDPDTLQRLIAHIQDVHISVAVEDYLLQIIHSTRGAANIEVGASPRAALALARASQARAAMSGRGFVTPDDVRELAIPVLAHRIIPTAQADLLGKSAQETVQEVVDNTHVPTEPVDAR